MKKRIIFDLILAGAIFYAPWWFVLVFAAMGAFIWPMYYEIIAFGVLVDLLYGTKSLPFGGIFGTIAAVLIFVAGAYAKKSVR